MPCRCQIIWTHDTYAQDTEFDWLDSNSTEYPNMAFRFTWPEFDASFTEKARLELENALNRGTKPSNICDRIQVVRLHMGSHPPQLDILEIGELTEERFRGIFKFTYTGDAHVVLQTRVQANPLSLDSGTSRLDGWMGPAMVAADAPLIVPLELTISQFKLRGIFVVIVSLMRGVTVSFKNEPLESVQVNSTFDNVPAIRIHLQREIQNRLSYLFKDEIPLMAHHMAMAPLRRVADLIPASFRTSPAPAGFFRHGRSDSWTGAASSATPSRANSPVGGISDFSELRSSTRAFDEIYYFRKHNIIHKTVSKSSTWDPLVPARIPDLQTLRQATLVLEDILQLAERVPVIGDEMKDLLEKVFFPSGRSIVWISRGLADLVSNTDHPEDSFLCKPSIYKAPRLSSMDGFNESMEHLSVHDPQEFWSLDSLALSSSIPIRTKVPPRSTGPSIGNATVQRLVKRGSLASKLRILRSCHANSSPVLVSFYQFTIHRSHPHSVKRT